MPDLDVPYSYRVLALLLFALCAVAWDLTRGRGTRLGDYSFLLGCGLSGCLFGVLNDLETSSLSPEYFVYGKAIVDDESFRVSVALLGARAGFSAGIIAGAVLLFANRSGSATSPGPALPYGTLWLFAGMTVIAAIVLGIIGGALFRDARPSFLTSGIEGLLTGDRVSAFVEAWGIHFGLYLGLATGLVSGVVGIRSRRRALSSEDALGRAASSRPA